MPIIGQIFSRDEIHRMFGGDKVSYLPNRDGFVLCATLTKKYNPNAPQVILPGKGPKIQRAARILAEQKEAIPVFIKKQVNQWEYVGDFQYTIDEARRVIEKYAREANRIGDVTMVLIAKGHKKIGRAKF